MAPSNALVAVSNEKGAFGSPSTAVVHFTYFTNKFQIQFIKNLRFFQEWVRLKAYYMYFQEHVGFIWDPQSIFAYFGYQKLEIIAYLAKIWANFGDFSPF